MPANLGRVLSQLCPHVLKIHTDEYKMTQTDREREREREIKR